MKLKNQLRLVGLLGMSLLPAVGPATAVAGPATQTFAPRELMLLAGAGQDTASVEAFLPHTVRVRAGDTVTWRINADADHTVSFTQGTTPPTGPRPNPMRPPGELIPQAQVNVPNPAGGPSMSILNPPATFPTRAPGAPVEVYSGSGFVSSGRLQRTALIPGVPNETFSLTFDRPGTYGYLCLVHPAPMQGTIEVAPASAADVPDQFEIDAMAQTETADLMARMERARSQGQAARNEPGPNGTTMWYVRAGNSNNQIDDSRVALLEFLPRDVTIKTGDTVVWGSFQQHTATFIPVPPAPEWLLPQAQPDGSWRVQRNPQILAAAKPSGAFDPTQYFNSGPLGGAAPGGIAWALTFDQPGTYEYICALHQEQGMKGSITVLAR